MEQERSIIDKNALVFYIFMITAFFLKKGDLMVVVFRVKVIPQSGRQQLVWDEKSGILKVFLKSAPEKNKANNELLKIFRKILGIPLQQIGIIAGNLSRIKTIRITSDLSQDAIFSACGIQMVQQQKCL